MSDTISLNCFPKNMTEHLVATIKSILHETRVFPPDPEFVKQANLSGMETYHALCAEAEKDLSAFWARLAEEHILWHKPFTRVLDESNHPFFKMVR